MKLRRMGSCTCVAYGQGYRAVPSFLSSFDARISALSSVPSQRLRLLPSRFSGSVLIVATNPTESFLLGIGFGLLYLGKPEPRSFGLSPPVEIVDLARFALRWLSFRSISLLPDVGRFQQHASAVQQDGFSFACCCTILCPGRLRLAGAAQHPGAPLLQLLSA